MTYTEAVQLAIEGNERGFGFLYQNTYKSKLYLSLQYMKNESDAEDVLQDAYVKAFSNLKDLKDPEKFSSWLGQIVANTAKNALVKKNPVLFTDIPTEGEEEESFEEQIADEDTSTQPELSYTREETRQMVQELIDSLSDEQRVCILMYHMEDMPIKDIAAALDCSESTVKSRLNYGRKNLKAKVEEMQKKGYKLYSVAPFVLLPFLLHTDSEAMYSEPAFTAAGRQISNEVFDQIPSLTEGGGTGEQAAGEESQSEEQPATEETQPEEQTDTEEVQSETEEAGEVEETAGTEEAEEAGETGEAGETAEAGEEAAEAEEAAGAEKAGEAGKAAGEGEGAEAGEEAAEAETGTTEEAGEAAEETAGAGESAARGTIEEELNTATETGEAGTGAAGKAGSDITAKLDTAGKSGAGTGAGTGGSAAGKAATGTGTASTGTGAASTGTGTASTGTGATAAGTGAAAKGGFGAWLLNTTIGNVIIGAGAVIIIGGVIFGVSNVVQRSNQPETVIEEAPAEEEEEAAPEVQEPEPEPEAEEPVEEEEPEEEEQAQVVTTEMFPDMLEGGMTKSQFEELLGYAPVGMTNGQVSSADVSWILSDLAFDSFFRFSDSPEKLIGVEGSYRNEYAEDAGAIDGYFEFNLEQMNNYLSVLISEPLTSENLYKKQNSIYNDKISGNTLTVVKEAGDYGLSQQAAITDAMQSGDTMILNFSVTLYNSVEYTYEDRYAILKQTDSGRFRIDSVSKGTVDLKAATQESETAGSLKDLYVSLLKDIEAGKYEYEFETQEEDFIVDTFVIYGYRYFLTDMNGDGAEDLVVAKVYNSNTGIGTGIFDWYDTRVFVAEQEDGGWTANLVDDEIEMIGTYTDAEHDGFLALVDYGRGTGEGDYLWITASSGDKFDKGDYLSEPEGEWVDWFEAGDLTGLTGLE